MLRSFRMYDGVGNGDGDMVLGLHRGYGNPPGAWKKWTGAGVVSGRWFHRARREMTWDSTGGMVAREKIPKPPTVVTTFGTCGLGGRLAIPKNGR